MSTKYPRDLSVPKPFKGAKVSQGVKEPLEMVPLGQSPEGKANPSPLDAAEHLYGASRGRRLVGGTSPCKIRFLKQSKETNGIFRLSRIRTSHLCIGFVLRCGILVCIAGVMPGRSRRFCR